MPPETDNLRVEELFAADQKDREKVYSSAKDIEALKTRDRARRKELLELMGHGQVNTQNDLYRAAVVLMHGADPGDFLIAHRLALISAVQGHRDARWLAAATLDRFLMSIGRPQVYGTQFERGESGSHQLRLPVDDATLLHFEKRFLGVPSVLDRLAQLNRRTAG